MSELETNEIRILIEPWPDRVRSLWDSTAYFDFSADPFGTQESERG